MATRNAETLEQLCELLEKNAGDTLAACAALQVSTGWLRTWMREDPKVEARIKDAIDTGAAVLESAMIKRAVEGVKQPIYYKDQKVGSKRVYSDTLLIKALESRKPETYGKRVEVNQNVNVKHLSDDDLDKRIDMLMQRLGVQAQLPAPVEAEFELVPHDAELLTVDDLL